MTCAVSSPAFVVTAFSPVEVRGADITFTCVENEIQNVEANNFSISPNPSSGEFLISFKETPADGNVEIVNTLGEKIFSEKISNVSEMKMNLGKIPAGLYFVRLNNNTIQKIIID